MPEEKSVSLIMSFAYDCICKEEIFNSYLAFVKNQSKKKRTVRTNLLYLLDYVSEVQLLATNQQLISG